MNYAKLIGVIIVLVAFSVVSMMMFYYRGQAQTVKSQFQDFRDKAQAAAQLQQADIDRKEKLYEDMVHTAYADRDAALFKLRHEQSISRASVVPPLPAGAVNADTICFAKSGLDAALERFIAGAQGLVVEGTQAVIDNKAWSASWPK